MAEPVQAVIAVGSNIDKERNLPEAIHMLRRAPGVTVEKVSRVYQSRSVGGGDAAPDFFNAAVLVSTDLDYQGLHRVARDIEDRLDRERTADRNAPRTADLDIVYFADLVADDKGTTVPDPDALTAAHVAVPVADAAPDWVHPRDGRTASEIAEQFQDQSVHPVMALHLTRAYDHPEDFDDVGDVYSPRMESLVKAQLVELGEDPEREGLQRTPLRVAKALDYLTSGYQTSLEEIINGALFDAEGAEEMVMVKDVEFYSMCEHHMLPFFGTAAVAYLPKGKIIGLSKIARIVDVYARRLQVQERMTNQIALALEECLEPHGVAVVLEGKHLCMMMRGVQKQESSMVTSAMRGTFSDSPRTRAEFLELIRD